MTGDGRSRLAIAVNDAEPTPVHGETIALALAELGRCDEALGWMKRAVAEAERAKDNAGAARLRREMPKYEGGDRAGREKGIRDSGIRNQKRKAGPKGPALLLATGYQLA